MADAAVEQKQRKSVAFEEGSVIMDTNGQVQDAPAAEKPAGMHPISHNPQVNSRTLDSGPANGAYPHTENDVDEVTEMFKGLSKKKKSKKSKDSEAGEGEETPAADGEFDPSALKKKKKKPKKETTDSEAKAEAGAATEEGEEKAEEPVPEGDPEAGTGIWQHDNTQAVPYSLLCLREGNRRTIFANIADICKRIKRSDEHVTQFLFAELGTSGSVDGSRRLVIKGRFQQKGIESVLRRYIVEYVTCKTCRSPDTELNKGENRLYFVTCNSCGSRRSVAAIKTGFRGQVGRRKRTG
ncbi:domain found in IF2B/IF5-domain-containing protein [Penicillium maclennaniae]|uniref:domain found in IF2B/IF5-domain-containing protein n=1 Tax=Penicillium maclennaniae TaxID=1343394 RepID=UPI002541076A|nr:domain found in IF2B/IF5-domain-containing protein [Penicillium maclennaniae]KAJ5668099.1 domain found in IF2B/IF5-domain-containing protein [Penicillium maclennaniae]